MRLERFSQDGFGITLKRTIRSLIRSKTTSVKMGVSRDYDEETLVSH
ncbi:hypothetical protein [Streptococcus salivarius]